MIRASWWITLADRIICLIGWHDWKRAVRNSDTTGIEACKRCPKSRVVTLRKAKERTLGKHRSHAAPYTAETVLPRSQWPSQGGVQ